MPTRARAKPREAVTEAGKRTRDALLDAGCAVSERDGLSGLSVNAVVAEAGLAKGTFYVHFTDREAFLAALQERFHTNLALAVASAVSNLPHGAKRLLAGIEASLDSCLAQRGLKVSLREIGFGRGDSLASLVDPNLRALGCRDVAVTARLLVAMISETALVELEAGTRSAAARRSLRRLVELAAT